MYLEKQNGQSLLVQAIFFVVFFPGTGGVVFTILYICWIYGKICYVSKLADLKGCCHRRHRRWVA